MTSDRPTSIELRPILVEHETTHRPGARLAFLDRDGVINRNRDGYVRTINEVEILPFVADAVEILRLAGYQIVIATNQSAIGRGIISRSTAVSVNDYIVSMIGASSVRASVICPHVPADGCACRKPRTLMIDSALTFLGAQRSGSILIGDAVSDIMAAQAANLHPFLVQSGRASSEELAAYSTQIPVVDDLHAAACQLLHQSILEKVHAR